MNGETTLLIVDDDERYLGALTRALSSDYHIVGARSVAEALQRFSPPPDLVLLDLRLGEANAAHEVGIGLLEQMREMSAQVPIIMLTAYGDVETAVRCMRLGAVDYIEKLRADVPEIRARLTRTLTNSRLSRKLAELEHEIEVIEPRTIVAGDPKMDEIRRMIEAVARDASVTVLVRGETGTGKELVARAIHASGPRSGEPFVAVTLNSLPSQTIEGELFGYEPGAFTDARRRHIGYFERAHRGMLFLDEIGEVEPTIQPKLLRFLEERELLRLGGHTTIPVNVQVVAASNAALEELVEAGRFRQDLYFRLKVCEIVVPPLRARADDIPLLIRHFLQTFRRQGKRIGKISPAALALANEYTWPGNIRQLRNTIESAIFWAELRGHGQIEAEDLPLDIQSGLSVSAHRARPGDQEFSISEALARAELGYVREALLTARGRKQFASQLLGYNDRFALLRRVKRILKDYPHLNAQYPEVADAFGEKSGKVP